MSNALHQILTYLLMAAGVALTTYLFPVLKKCSASFESELRNRNYMLAAEIVHNAVYAVEQLVAGSGQGEIKFLEAKKLIRTGLEQYGISMTDEQITTMIEAVVGVMNTDRVELLEEVPEE